MGLIEIGTGVKESTVKDVDITQYRYRLLGD
jgi:hypothetical protein